MDTKKNTNEIFRIAFEYLKNVREGKLKEVADACGCSDKWLGNILNKGAGPSPKLKQKIAEFYHTTIDEMLVMGMEIKQNGIPGVVVSMNGRDNLTNIVATNGATATSTQSSSSGAGEFSDREREALRLLRKHGEKAFRALEMFDRYGNEHLLDKCLSTLTKAKKLFS